MVWPVARDVFGRKLQSDHNLFFKAGKGELHVVSMGHIAQSLAERRREQGGTKSPEAISVRRSIEVTSVREEDDLA